MRLRTCRRFISGMGLQRYLTWWLVAADFNLHARGLLPSRKQRSGEGAARRRGPPNDKNILYRKIYFFNHIFKLSRNLYFFFAASLFSSLFNAVQKFRADRGGAASLKSQLRPFSSFFPRGTERNKNRLGKNSRDDNNGSPFRRSFSP